MHLSRSTTLITSMLVALAGSTLAGDWFTRESRAASADSSIVDDQPATQPGTQPDSAPKDSRKGKGGSGRGEGGRGGGGNGGGNGGGGQGNQPGSLMQRMAAFQTDVPAHDLDVVLARPTPRSITVSLVAATDREARVEYREKSDQGAARRSAPSSLVKGRTGLIELEGLKPDAEYAYRVVWSTSGAESRSDEYRFVTPPEQGSSRPFTFVIQADSHLDSNMDPLVYAQSLRNMLADRPAFLMDLGDTFMTDKRREFKETLAQYDAQRYYFGLLCHSASLFMVLGNHDGETGATNPNQVGMPAWSYEMRTGRFPAPRIDDGGWYTGQTAMKDGKGGNHYAFEWGNSLFITLDPFWNTTERPRGGGGGRGGSGGSGPGEPNANTDQNWTKTLGREQFDWLERTLTASKAAHRFVFIHHLVGGLGKDSRGGMEASSYFEWGGKNADGSPGFAEHRKGWSMPIHDLLVKHGVEAVFHGHDHLFVRNERDGLVYQCVPQPGNSLGGTRSARDYGYLSGTILASPGYLRVSVDEKAAKVELIRSALPAGQSRRQEREPNGAVVHAYELNPRASGVTSKKETNP